MAVDLLLLHSSDQPVPDFNALRDRIAPAATLEHVVRRDWSARAIADGMTWQLRREIDIFVRESEAPVLTTCGALSEAIEFAGGMRVERAMLKAAARSKGPLLLVSALSCALDASENLLAESMAAEGNVARVTPLLLDQFWPLYTSGDTAGFHAAVAAALIEALEARPDLRGIILGQVAMAPVEHLLDGSGVTVFSAPERAMGAALAAHALSSLGDPITT